MTLRNAIGWRPASRCSIFQRLSLNDDKLDRIASEEATRELITETSAHLIVIYSLLFSRTVTSRLRKPVLCIQSYASSVKDNLFYSFLRS